MPNLKVHHIGYIVKKSAPARDAFTALGYAVVRDFVRDESRGIDIAFLKKDGVLVELVCPFRNDSTVSGLMKRTGNAPYHICYASTNYDADTAELLEAGYLPFTGCDPAPAMDGLRVQFFMHPQIGMIEVIEGEPSFD